MAGARRPAGADYPYRCCYCGRNGVEFFYIWHHWGPLSEACSVGPHSCRARVEGGQATGPPGLLAPALRAVLLPLVRDLDGLPQDFELRLALFLVRGAFEPDAPAPRTPEATRRLRAREFD